MNMISVNEYDDAIGNVYDKRIVGRLSRYLRPYVWPILVSVVLLLAVAVLEIVGPLLIKYAIDEQIAQGRTDRLGLLVALFLGSLTAIFVMRYAQGVLMNYVSQRIMVDLRMQLFGHLQRMSI